MSILITPKQAAALLEEFCDQSLPIAKYLNLQVLEYDGEIFKLGIDLKPSINDKLTAFGGSLYCVSVVNCWGMVYMQARQRGINPNLVVSHAEIDYLAPVDDELIVSTCSDPSDMSWDHFFDKYQQTGKTRANVSSSIHCRGKEAVRFKGQYAIIGLYD